MTTKRISLAKSQIIAIIVSIALMFGIFVNTAQISSASADDSARLEGTALAEQIQSEGSVLVKNNGALPLSKTDDSAVSIFGWGSTDWVSSGSGSGRSRSSSNDLTSSVGIYEALANYGIDTYEPLKTMYTSFMATRPYYNCGDSWVRPHQASSLYEPSITDKTRYTDDLLNGAKTFSDVAFVVINRVTGEAHDTPKVQYKGKKTSGAAQTPDDPDRHTLEISTEEEALLTYVGQNYDKVIVLINSTNTMELGFMDSIAGLDACLVVGGTGQVAANAIPKVLYGEISPSGKLVDTIPYDFKYNPTYYSSGIEGLGIYDGTQSLSGSSRLYPNNTTNSAPTSAYPGVSYVDYIENIYLGYKWFETADAEGYWNSKTLSTLDGTKVGYNATVQYPFGYGLSYTTFEWKVIAASPAPGTALTKDGKISVSVEVTNTGAVAGKDVVELYYTAPYTKNGIEKSATTLAAYEKTSTLAPGASEIVSLTFDVEDMASYDCYDKNNNSFKGYELDAGSYKVELKKDSHNVATVATDGQFKSATLNYTVASNIQYPTDTVTGVTVDNKFTGEDAENGIPIDGSLESTPVQFLTRGNFATDFTTLVSQDRTMTDKVRPFNRYNAARATEQDDATATQPTMGVNNNLKIGSGNAANFVISDLGKELAADYDDPRWETLIQQISQANLSKISIGGTTSTVAISEVGKPSTSDLDGPIQVRGWSSNYGTGMPTIPVLAATWNKSLAKDFGLNYGKEAKAKGMNGWYGPGINMHRSPFSGRNYEYYSEDSLLTGTMAAETIKGARARGLYSYMKHLVLYEQEANRDGQYTWLTEQTLRENFLKPFKITIQEGGLTGIMSSYNRIGAIGTSESYSLMTEVVRNEFGFKGAMVTDWADYTDYMTMDAALRAGGDLYMGTSPGWRFSSVSNSSNASFNRQLQRAAKNVIYMYLEAQYTADLYANWGATEKAAAKTDLSAYKTTEIAGLTEAQKNSITSTISKYSAFIDDATDQDGIDGYVTIAKTVIDNIIADANYVPPTDDEPTKPEKESKGCGAITTDAGTTTMLFALLLSASMIFIKLPSKKQKQN